MDEVPRSIRLNTSCVYEQHFIIPLVTYYNCDLLEPFEA